MRTSRVLLGALSLAVGVSLVSGGAGARAASNQPVSGTIVSRQVTGPTCTSPVGLCTAGEFRGGIRGSFEFSATGLIPTVDTPTTGVVLYTGDLRIHTKDGDLFVKDAGAFSPGSGDVASVSTIIGGSALLGAAGSIRISGIFREGCVDCEYKGRLRLP